MELQNTSSNVMCSGTITVAKGATLTGTATVQAVTMQQGATFVCTLTLSNSKLTVKGNLTHNGDTLLIHVPSYRKLKEGDELTVFDVAGTHKGEVVVKAEAEDGTYYVFDTTSLLTDGKVRVVSVSTGIHSVENGQSAMDDQIYDLQGRRVPTSKHGLYIKNGKNVIIR